MSEREAAILSLARVVGIKAAQTARRTGHVVEAEDLYAPAWIGAIQAVDQYNPDRGALLRTYADRRIHGAIQDYLRSVDRLGRSHRKAIKDGLEEAPGFVSVDALIQVRDCRERNHIIRLLAEEALSAPLLVRERRVVMAYFFEGRSMREIGSAHSVGESRVSQLIKGAIAKMREWLGLTPRGEEA